MKTKRILYFHYDGGQSGATKSLSFLMEHVNKNQLFKPKVICFFEGQAANLFRENKIPTKIVDNIYSFNGSTVSGMSVHLFLRNFYRLPASFINAILLIEQEQPDIIHLNSSCLFAVAYAAKRVNPNIKVICHIREPLLNYSFSAFLIRSLNKRYVDQFIAVDKFSAASIGNCTSSNTKVVVYNSVNFESQKNIESKQQPKYREYFNIPADAPLFLNFGRITKCNGVLAWLKIIEQLVNGNDKFHFIIAGFKNPNDKYEIEVKLKALNIKNVHVLPFLDDIASLISESDVVVVPFIKPHFSRSVIESFASGKPVICPNIGGLSEIVQTGITGFLYENDVEFLNFCNKLGNDSSLCKSMGKNAYNVALANFDSEITAKQVMDIYQEIAI